MVKLKHLTVKCKISCKGRERVWRPLNPALPIYLHNYAYWYMPVPRRTIMRWKNKKTLQMTTHLERTSAIWWLPNIYLIRLLMFGEEPTFPSPLQLQCRHVTQVLWIRCMDGSSKSATKITAEQVLGGGSRGFPIRPVWQRSCKHVPGSLASSLVVQPSQWSQELPCPLLTNSFSAQSARLSFRHL